MSLFASKNIYVRESEEVITIDIYQPIVDEHGDYSTAFSIVSSTDRFDKILNTGKGLDAVLSIVLALRKIGSELFHLDQKVYLMKLEQFKNEASNDPYYGFLPLGPTDSYMYMKKKSDK